MTSIPSSSESGKAERAAFEACPFCGKSVSTLTTAAELMDEPDEYTHSESWAVMCDASAPGGPGGCGASGGFFPSEQEAIEAWNRRAALSAKE